MIKYFIPLILTISIASFSDQFYYIIPPDGCDVEIPDRPLTREERDEINDQIHRQMYGDIPSLPLPSQDVIDELKKRLDEITKDR